MKKYSNENIIMLLIVAAMVVASILLPIGDAKSANNKLYGVFTNNINSIEHVANFSNSIVITANSLEELSNKLVRTSQNNLIPVLTTGIYFLDMDKGFVYRDTKGIINTINKYNESPKIVIMFDEFLWITRRLCTERNVQTACVEVANNYPNTKKVLARIISDFRNGIDNVEIIQVEAYPELYLQYVNTGKLHYNYSVEYIAFDCYGNVDACSSGASNIPPVPTQVYLEKIYENIIANNSKAKIVLIPGGFVSSGYFSNESETLDHLQFHFNACAQYPDICGGILVFTWSSFIEDGHKFIGTSQLPNVKSFVQKNLFYEVNK